MSFATDRLEALVSGNASLPTVVQYLKMGGLDAWRPGYASKTYTLHDEFKHADGTLYGGYLSALADQIITFTAMTVIPDGFLWRTQSLSVDYFRLIRGEKLSAQGEVRNKGATLIHVSADFTREDGKLAASAKGVMFLTPNT